MFERTPEERAEDEAVAAAFAAERQPTSGESAWRPPGIPGFVVEENPGLGSYVIAALIPVVGVVLAIRQFARNNIGPALARVPTASAS